MNAVASIDGASPRLSARLRDALLFNAFYFVAAADVTSVSIGGGSVRLAWVLLPVLTLLLPSTREDRFTFASVVALFGVHVIASVASGEIAKGLVYSAWILANYVFFFRTGYVLSRRMGNGVWDAFLLGGRIQAVLGVLLFALGLHERTRFIYYEPSYLAIGLVPYLFCVVFWSKFKPVDYGLILAVLVTNQSANMLIACLVAIGFGLICTRRFLLTTIIVIGVPTLVYAAYRLTLQNPDSPNFALASFVHDNGLDPDLWVEILGRAGNRFPRVQAALQVLDGHWAMGIGPGRYTEITENMDFVDITGGLDYLDPAGLPVINVVLEAIASAGIAAAIVMVAYSLYMVRRVLAVAQDRPRWIMLGCLCAIFVMLQIESSYLRAYVWFAFGVFLARTPALRAARAARIVR